MGPVVAGLECQAVAECWQQIRGTSRCAPNRGVCCGTVCDWRRINEWCKASDPPLPEIKIRPRAAFLVAACPRCSSRAAKRDVHFDRLRPPKCGRCGVHTGKVLVGNLGFHSRMKYGIVGEAPGGTAPHRAQSESRATRPRKDQVEWACQDAAIPGKLEELNKTFETSHT